MWTLLPSPLLPGRLCQEGPEHHSSQLPYSQNPKKAVSEKRSPLIFMQTPELLRTHSSGAEGSFQSFLHPGNLGTLRAKARVQLELSRKNRETSDTRTHWPRAVAFLITASVPTGLRPSWLKAVASLGLPVSTCFLPP